MGELGLAFVKLTKLETEGAMFESQTIRANDMKNVATASVKASRLYRELNSQTVKHLVTYTSYICLDIKFAEKESYLILHKRIMSVVLS